MILDQFLNESYNPTIGVVEPLFESYIQGEDANEICMMTEDFNRDIERLDEGVMLAESLAFVCEQKGEYEKAAVLQENAVTDFFKKLKDMIVKLWQKVKAFFVNLFKSIDVAMRDVSKSLSGIDKYLNKDFSEFSYDGHKWTSKPTIQNTIGTAASTKIKALKTTITAEAKHMDYYTKHATVLKDTDDGVKESFTNVNAAISDMVGKSGTMTIEQAKDVIKKHWGYTTSTEAIKNFAGGYSSSDMVQFLKDFNKNKVLTDLKKESDDKFKEAVTAVSEAQKEVEKISANSEAKDENITNFNTNKKKAISNIKIYSTRISNIVSAYDKLMGECIACEKAKFSEFRRVIGAAVRYKAKEK